MRISAVVPTWREASTVAHTVSSCLAVADEVVVCDAHSDDATVTLATRAGARVVFASKSRGAQLNAGALYATGDVLLFVHADTTLPFEARAAMHTALASPKVVGGNFKLRFVPETPSARFYSFANDMRRRFMSVYYGDSCIFVRRSVFESLGGFPAMPLFEDYAFSRALESFGQTHYITDVVIDSSNRRFAQRPVRTLALWGLLQLLYELRVSPERLARLYADIR